MSRNPITENQVRALARLARLSFEPEEISALVPEMQSIIGCFEQLQDLDLPEGAEAGGSGVRLLPALSLPALSLPALSPPKGPNGPKGSKGSPQGTLPNDTGIQPLAPLREDIPGKSLSPEDVARLAPRLERHHFIVPRILD